MFCIINFFACNSVLLLLCYQQQYLLHNIVQGLAMGLSEFAFALTDTVLKGLLLPLALLTGGTLLAFQSEHCW